MSHEEQPTPENAPPAKRGRLARWFFPLFALAVLVGLAFVLFSKLRNDVWAYFTDDEGTRVEVEEEKTRFVLWQDPKQNLFNENADPAAPDDSVNQPTGRLEASFSEIGRAHV